MTITAKCSGIPMQLHSRKAIASASRASCAAVALGWAQQQSRSEGALRCALSHSAASASQPWLLLPQQLPPSPADRRTSKGGAWHRDQQRCATLVCRVAELQQDELQLKATLEALEHGDKWVPQHEVICMLADASHMSLECDFDPQEILRWLKQNQVLTSSGRLTSQELPEGGSSPSPFSTDYPASPAPRLPTKAKITRIPSTASPSHGRPPQMPVPAACQAASVQQVAGVAMLADAPAPGSKAQPHSEPAAVVVDVARLEALRNHPLLVEVELLEQLISRLQAISSTPDKVLLLMSQLRTQAFISDPRHRAVAEALKHLEVQQQYVLLSLLAMGQAHVLTAPLVEAQPVPQHQEAAGAAPVAAQPKQQLRRAQQQQQQSQQKLQTRLVSLAASLQRVEQFYDSIGGVLGYQCRSLDLIIAGTPELRLAQRLAHQLSRRAAQAAGAPGRSGGSQAAAVHQEQPAALEAADEPQVSVSYHVPRALDLAGEGGREVGMRTAAAGLVALPHMAEIYPVGGAGDRLGLMCEVTGECLPAAMLPYCGRTMMEGLVRDLQAREYLYFKLTGKQVTTPVAIMSSEAKGNDRRITQLMESLRWFGRGRDAFRIFKQPLVPVMSVADGRWLLEGAMQPMSKPGGHGAIWKLMWDEGIFTWLSSQGRTAALVRQISNPMAGMDTTLLALTGCGYARRNSAFGFMSCDRTIGASEGCNVLQERRVRQGDRVSYEYGYTNIEYTEFDRLGISDQPVDGNSRRSVFPANTNVLYVGLQEAKKVVESAVRQRSPDMLMPGLIFNLKKKVAYQDPLTGQAEQLCAGRMECTMQNIADYMTDKVEVPLSPSEAAARELPTFLVYNMRRKVTSSAKKRREPGSTRISQTPDGSFYDLQRNAWHLLQQCAVKQVPEGGSVEQYLQDGPGFIFLFHPALGPLWDVISQKLVGGSLQHGSEMVLEVAEARLRDVHVEGSLLIHADNVMGHTEPAASCVGSPVGASQPAKDLQDQDRLLQYSNRCGRVHMSNVRVRNTGIDWVAPGNVYWKHQVARREAVLITLHGQSEFEAHDVTLVGAHSFEVHDGFRMTVSQDASGKLNINLSPLVWGLPTWQWVYTMCESGQVHLQFTSSSGAAGVAQGSAATGSPGPVAPHPKVGLPPGLMSQAALSASALGATKRVRSPTPAPSVDGTVTAGSGRPLSKYGMLQRLMEMESEVDFNI